MIVRTLKSASTAALFRTTASREVVSRGDQMGHAVFEPKLRDFAGVHMMEAGLLQRAQWGRQLLCCYVQQQPIEATMVAELKSEVRLMSKAGILARDDIRSLLQSLHERSMPVRRATMRQGTSRSCL